MVRTLIPWLLASALLMAVPLPVGSAPGSGGEWVWLSNMDGQTVDHTGPPGQTHTCEAISVMGVDFAWPGPLPPPRACANVANPHVLGSPYFMTIGFPINPPGPTSLDGTLQILVSHQAGNVDFRCSWSMNVWTGCMIASLVWPAPGATFDVACMSLGLANGNWECAVSHP
jgi:hypothetical protein